MDWTFSILVSTVLMWFSFINKKLDHVGISSLNSMVEGKFSANINFWLLKIKYHLENVEVF